MIARVLPEGPIDKVFDYTVPESVRDRVRVGTMVRIELHGRRVGGWVVGLSDEPATNKALKPLAKVTGWGPPAELVELAEWAAWRWAGRRSSFLRTASPPAAVTGLPPPRAGAGPAHPPVENALAVEALARRQAVLRLPPAADVFPLVLSAASLGPALVLTPGQREAAHVAMRLRRAGVPVAAVPRDWAAAAAGGCTVVGARAGAWAPVPGLTTVVVLDEHDETYAEERAPTWNARDVAVERARRAGVPCVLASPCPSLEALAWGELFTPSRMEERAGWPVLDIVDRRTDDPRTGLYSERLVNLLRGGGRVVCVLNRKGRARLLTCAACGELARCEACEGPVVQVDDGLRCARCGTRRPAICQACGATKLKARRLGVSRAREDLVQLVREGVVEVTSETDPAAVDQGRIFVGTEAVLHRVEGADAVAFLDFDLELLAPRYRAAEQALALLARAARLVGGRDGGGRLLVQTRLPRHEVLHAVLHADPSRLTAVEGPRRVALGFPPATALALVSGEAAGEFVEQLRGVDVLGPADGAWMVRAPDHQALCDALAAVVRPAGRLRLEIDPLRA